MTPSSKPTTVDEFLAMSSAQRKALPREIYSKFFGEAVVKGLNEATAKIQDLPAPEQPPRSADLQAAIDRKLQDGYQKALKDPATQMMLENLRRNSLKAVAEAKQQSSPKED